MLLLHDTFFGVGIFALVTQPMFENVFDNFRLEVALLPVARVLLRTLINDVLVCNFLKLS